MVWAGCLAESERDTLGEQVSLTPTTSGSDHTSYYVLYCCWLRDRDRAHSPSFVSSCRAPRASRSDPVPSGEGKPRDHGRGHSRPGRDLHGPGRWCCSDRRCRSRSCRGRSMDGWSCAITEGALHPGSRSSRLNGRGRSGGAWTPMPAGASPSPRMTAGPTGRPGTFHCGTRAIERQGWRARGACDRLGS